MSLKKLNEKSKEFNLTQEYIDKRENGRLSFVSKFPLDEIKDLSIDQFVQGTDDNSFCYWLEFKKIGFGIGGGNIHVDRCDIIFIVEWGGVLLIN